MQRLGDARFEVAAIGGICDGAGTTFSDQSHVTTERPGLIGPRMGGELSEAVRQADKDSRLGGAGLRIVEGGVEQAVEIACRLEQADGVVFVAVNGIERAAAHDAGE